MNFLKFQTELRPLLVFNSRDIRKVDPEFNPVNLNNWQSYPYLTKLGKGLYTFADYVIEKELLYFAANKIIDPSYISCESALSFYGILKMEDPIVSVNPVKTHKYKSEYGGYKFHKTKPALMKDYDLVLHNQHYFKIATPEKAIVDFFFFNPKYQTRIQIKSLPFDAGELANNVVAYEIQRIANEYRNDLLDRRITNFKKIFI